MAMNQILDFTKDYDYSDEKIKEFRKILKSSLTLVKSMATNEVVMDSIASDFRETLGKATEQMIFFISGAHSIGLPLPHLLPGPRTVGDRPKFTKNLVRPNIGETLSYEFAERRS